MYKAIYAAALSLSLLLLSGLSARAEPILTVTLPDRTAAFTLQDLQALGQTTFTTTTIWTEGEQTFTGVPLGDLVRELGVTGGEIEAIAINDYSVTFPVQDALADGPIVAYHLNGAPMSVRDKGPLWIVYPYAANPDFRTEVVYSRSIWQLVRLTVRN